MCDREGEKIGGRTMKLGIKDETRRGVRKRIKQRRAKK